tara:strand:- start:4968 stop:5804 length:837 start_codon:yes stop_codon:yes gene_type:complete
VEDLSGGHKMINEQRFIVKSYNESILEELSNIAAPIQDALGVSLLTFRRLYTNGKIIHLSNHKEWLDSSFENSFWQSSSSLLRINQIAVNEQYAHIWKEDAHRQDPVYNAMFSHNMWNGLTLYDKRDDYVDLWSFATDRENHQVLDVYVNELRTIKQFILYLHDKGKPLFLPDNLDISISTENHFSTSNPAPEVEKREPLFKTEKYYLDSKFEKYLTRKEFLCLILVAEGKSTKDVSRALDLSHRTVDSHINSIKRKTDSHFKLDMLKKCEYLLNMYR